MTGRGASAPRTRASRGAGRAARAAVIALLAALAVLVHHETAEAAIGPMSGPIMTPGMPMPAEHAAPVTTMPGHRHVSPAGQPAALGAPAASGIDRAGCSGMAMQHCTTASLEVVKLPLPVRTTVPGSLAASAAVATETEASGTIERAPPDLSVLSQLRT